MRIVSACLAGINSRFDEKNWRKKEIIDFSKEGRAKPLCGIGGKTYLFLLIKFLCAYLLAVSFVTGNGASDLDWLIQQVQEKYNETIDFKADFEQFTTIGSLGQSQKARGRVYLKKPGMMRWEYDEPEEQLIVSNGQMLWIYDPSLNQVIEHKWDQVYPSRVPTLFLAGLGDLRKDFQIFFKTPPTTRPPTKAYLLKLIPKDSQLNLIELILTIHPKSFLIVESLAKDNFGNTTGLLFSNIKINSGISASVFQFKPPQGAERIDASDMLPIP